MTIKKTFKKDDSKKKGSVKTDSKKREGREKGDNSNRGNTDKIEKDLKDLIEEVYKNNFSAYQEFNKTCNFTVRLKVPHYDGVPVEAEVGEIIESGGKLYICSSQNTWSLVGTQS